MPTPPKKRPTAYDNAKRAFMDNWQAGDADVDALSQMTGKRSSRTAEQAWSDYYMKNTPNIDRKMKAVNQAVVKPTRSTATPKPVAKPSNTPKGKK